MSDSVRPHRRQPTRLPRPWDSPGKNTGVGCHFLFQCMKVKSESEVAQSCLTLSDPMDCNLLGSSIHGIFQARVLEWGAIAFSVIFLLPRIIGKEDVVFGFNHQVTFNCRIKCLQVFAPSDVTGTCDHLHNSLTFILNSACFLFKLTLLRTH